VREAGAGKAGGRVAARASPARRGGVGRGQRGAREGGGRGAGGHVARLKAAWGQLGLGKWRAEAAGSRAREEQSRGAGG
jgi:hypothetical protein